MAVRQARVVVNEDPRMETVGRVRSPWKEIPREQFEMFRSMRRSSTGCAAAENAIKQGVLGAQFLVTAKGWSPEELHRARSAFMHMNSMAIEHLHTFGIVIVALNNATHLPGVVDPEMVQVWHSATLDGRSFYIVKQSDLSMRGGDQPLDVAVFELRRPHLNGSLDSPLAPAMKNFNYITMMQQAGVQASHHNANPRVFIQREREEKNVEEELKALERGSYAVNQRLAAGAVAQAAKVDEERVTRAIGLHEVERAGRHFKGLFPDGTSQDPLSGALVFNVTGAPNLYPLLDNQTVAAGPLAQAPPDLQSAIARGEDDIARVYGVPPSLWGDKQTSNVTQSTLVHVYLQTCAAWRTNLDFVNEPITRACAGGSDAFAIMRNDPTGDEKAAEERQSMLEDGEEPSKLSMLRDHGSLEAFAERASRLVPEPRRAARRRKREVEEETPAAPKDEEEKTPSEPKKRKQLTLRLRWGSAMDIYAIEQLYEQGRITFVQSQEYIARLRGLDTRDLTGERLDPQTQRPLAEVIEEAKAADGKTSGTKRKSETTLEGRDDLIRTPPKVTGVGDHGPSLRTVLTRKSPGQAKE